ncbi:hypothetical protein EB796_010876 [Bugula neritina]|uniref:Uncharacterized protein n=1 Tax=Bugula neritina TaxID=10212 RepID=A0A7J7JZQ7_BUGNE|nr:hypothetical protein EB796_010876 [Bugula neritina]
MYRNVKEAAISLTRVSQGIYLHGDCLAVIKNPILSLLFQIYVHQICYTVAVVNQDILNGCSNERTS